MSANQPTKPKYPTFVLPQKKCRVCGRPMEVTSKHPTCSWACHQEYQAVLNGIDAADKEETEMPF